VEGGGGGGNGECDDCVVCCCDDDDDDDGAEVADAEAGGADDTSGAKLNFFFFSPKRRPNSTPNANTTMPAAAAAIHSCAGVWAAGCRVSPPRPPASVTLLVQLVLLHVDDPSMVVPPFRCVLSVGQHLNSKIARCCVEILLDGNSLADF